MLRTIIRKIESFRHGIYCRKSKEVLERVGITKSFANRDSSALPPKYDDLHTLYALVKETRPKLILEYGSGVSTITMAHALMENARQGWEGKILSIESDSKWANHTMAGVPSALKPFIDMQVHTPELRLFAAVAFGQKEFKRGVWFRDQKRPATIPMMCIVYPALLDIAPDMVYLDGPDPRHVRGYSDCRTGETNRAIVADMLFQEQKLRPGFVLAVDGRNTNCAFLHNNLTARYSVEKREAQKFTIFKKLN